MFELGQSRFELCAAVGGRLTSASARGVELLVGRDVHPTNYGSTFWTSPQSAWAWPPISAVDNAPYTLTADDTHCTLTSAVVSGVTSAVDGLLVVKRFSADLEREALVAEYTLRNTSTAPKRVAPWEITRVLPGGLTFFASDVAPTPPPDRVMPQVVRQNGWLWSQDDAAVTHHAKLFADGKGWLAHATSDGLLLVKTFADLAPHEAAPGEAEIEVYAANPPGEPHGRYVEVENQGAYAEIAPGAESTWTVRWYLRFIPEHARIAIGDAGLTRFVRDLLV